MSVDVKRRRVPKSIAVIDPDHCTGCEACREMCPVDCIALISSDPHVKGIHSWCEVDLERCIGCQLCVHLPRKSTQTYELQVCPWDAIDMVPSEFLPQAVSRLGGPPEQVAEIRSRWLEPAQQVAEARLQQQQSQRQQKQQPPQEQHQQQQQNGTAAEDRA